MSAAPAEKPKNVYSLYAYPELRTQQHSEGHFSEGHFFDPITREDLPPLDVVITQCCQNVFSKTSMQKALQEKSSCPCCRAPLNPTIIENKNEGLNPFQALHPKESEEIIELRTRHDRYLEELRNIRFKDEQKRLGEGLIQAGKEQQEKAFQEMLTHLDEQCSQIINQFDPANQDPNNITNQLNATNKLFKAVLEVLKQAENHNTNKQIYELLEKIQKHSIFLINTKTRLIDNSFFNVLQQTSQMHHSLEDGKGKQKKLEITIRELNAQLEREKERLTEITEAKRKLENTFLIKAQSTISSAFENIKTPFSNSMTSAVRYFDHIKGVAIISGIYAASSLLNESLGQTQLLRYSASGFYVFRAIKSLKNKKFKEASKNLLISSCFMLPEIYNIFFPSTATTSIISRNCQSTDSLMNSHDPYSVIEVFENNCKETAIKALKINPESIKSVWAMSTKPDYWIDSHCEITIDPSFSESLKNWINPPKYLNEPVKIATDFFKKYCWPRTVQKVDYWTITVKTT
ncbi:MAG: hypothetical protein JXA94_06295 [Parachlamydiales bacterium]|nr:hypothetical protein [Parachlamydiales bacterium]